MKADYAEADLECKIQVRVYADGRIEHRVVYSTLGPATLTRQWTAKELRDDPTLQGDPWYEGGAAILSHKHATNGTALLRKIEEVGVPALREMTRKGTS